MLDKIRGKYACKSFAVVGSAPSATMFNHQQDVSIGVNGASSLLKPGDWFLSADQSAHRKSWFTEMQDGMNCVLRGISGMYSDRFYPDRSKVEPMIRKYEECIKENIEFVKLDSTGQPYVSVSTGGNAVLEEIGDMLPEPVDPHLILRRVVKTEPVHLRMKWLNSGGTSAGVALQLAVVAGASEIHLYGVEFSNDPSTPETYDGDAYFYEVKPGEMGKTTEKKRSRMDEIIQEVRDLEIPVFSHGPTRLESTIKLG